MRRDLIIIAEGSEVYLFGVNAPFKPVDNVGSVVDVVEAIEKQGLGHYSISISDKVDLNGGTVLFNIDGPKTKSYERNLYFYNFNKHRVVFSFLNKLIKQDGIGLCSSNDKYDRFEVSCLGNSKKHYRLGLICEGKSIFKSFYYDEV